MRPHVGGQRRLRKQPGDPALGYCEQVFEEVGSETSYYYNDDFVIWSFWAGIAPRVRQGHKAIKRVGRSP